MDKIKASSFADLAYYSRFKPPSRLVTFAAPASTLTNFPALVKCNSTFNIGTSTGYDVHFQDLSGNELPYELDYYDSVTGNGAWWVKIPSLSSSGSTSIKMLYGDSSASTNGSTPLTVWSDYGAVYHFNELSGTSQTNRADGVQSVANIGSAPSFQTYSTGTGRFLRGFCNGSANDMTLGLTTQMSLTSNSYSVTLLCYNRATSGSYASGALTLQCFITNIANTYTPSVHLMVFNNNAEHFYIGQTPFIAHGEVTGSSAGVVICEASCDEGVSRYANINGGTFGTGNGYTGTALSAFTDFYSFIPCWDANHATYDVDELRFCKSAHSQDWMNYEYAEYIDHLNTVTYGPEV